MILADGTMGQMMEPVALEDDARSTTADKPWAATGTKMSAPAQHHQLALASIPRSWSS